MHTLNKQLDQGRIVEVTYYSLMLYQQSMGQQTLYSSALHSSTLVGRRCKKNQVEYLLRNTYGTDCQKQEATVAHNAQGSDVSMVHSFSDYKFDCRVGHIWVPGKALRFHLRSLTWLE